MRGININKKVQHANYINIKNYKISSKSYFCINIRNSRINLFFSNLHITWYFSKIGGIIIMIWRALCHFFIYFRLWNSNFYFGIFYGIYGIISRSRKVLIWFFFKSFRFWHYPQSIQCFRIYIVLTWTLIIPHFFEKAMGFSYTVLDYINYHSTIL